MYNEIDYSHVAVSNSIASYSQEFPYHPAELYPEYPLQSRDYISHSPNSAYQAVRNALFYLGLDYENFGTPKWNPFRKIIRTGATVFVKPNWVSHQLVNDLHPEEILITHPSVIRAVIDYVLIACGLTGRIILGDAPLQGADFEKIISMSHIDSILELYQREFNFSIELIDCRKIVTDITKDGRLIQHDSDHADPLGYSEIDLAKSSFFTEIDSLAKSFRVSDYNSDVLKNHHHPGVHQYLIANSILQSDVFINIPKLKSHKQSGLTCSLKNLVGINGDKAYLPHYRTGSPNEQGDAYPLTSSLKMIRTEVRARLIFSKEDWLWKTVRFIGRTALVFRSRFLSKRMVGGEPEEKIYSGGWYGNDTTWRMILDLNLLLLGQNNSYNVMNSSRQYISIVDAIIAGDEHGPLEPHRRLVGTIIAGFSPVATDLVAAHYMGFDWQKIPLLRHAVDKLGVSFPADDNKKQITVESGKGPMLLDDIDINWAFRPALGWVDHIERK